MDDRKERIFFISGNEAAGMGALDAGLMFFAGYPITPSTEIAEMMSKELPKRNGRFIQMEDEIGSIAAVIGASLAGVKSMTATSGPGFSLMQENIGYGYMAEVPCVIINVQRGGPSTGLPTLPSQADVMQSRWGTHGDHPAICLMPSSVKEAYYMSVKAFNLSEKYRTPVVLLSDEVIGHMRERVILPPKADIEVINRKIPDAPKEEYFPFDDTKGDVPPLAPFGAGYRFNVTGLTHDKAGFPTARPDEISVLYNRLKRKIENNKNDICVTEELKAEDADILIISYGSVSRSAAAAVRMGRDEGQKIGLFRPVTIWPFPGERLAELASGSKKVVVAEMNEGQVYGEALKYISNKGKVISVTRCDGNLITPAEILRAAVADHSA